MEIVQALTWIRTEVLNNLLQEYEEQILYWRGKEIARKENLSNDHRLQQFFLQKGLGIMEFSWIDHQKLKVGITNSPLASEYQKAKKTIALEAGLITEMLQQKYKMRANGYAKWVTAPDHPPYIEVTVTLENPVF